MSLINYTKTHPIKLIFKIVIVCLIFFFLFPREKNEISKKMISTVNNCGHFSFISDLEINKNNEYDFKQVIGCNKARGKDCSFSAKGQNQFFLQSHKIDQESLKFINSFSEGEIGYYSDFSYLAQYQTIHELLSNLNNKPTEAYIATVKDRKKDLTHLIILTFYQRSDRSCLHHEAVNLLHSIALEVKK